MDNYGPFGGVSLLLGLLRLGVDPVDGPEGGRRHEHPVHFVLVNYSTKKNEKCITIKVMMKAKGRIVSSPLV